MPPVDGDDRAHGDAGRRHVDQQEGNAHLLLSLGVGAREAEKPIGVLRGRRPGLLAVDDIMVAVTHGAGLQRCEVGAGAGLGKSLRPPVVEICGARQEVALLLLRAESGDNRPDHVNIELQRLRHRIELQLLQEDVMLDRRPALTAPFDRPARRRPALGVQNALRGDHLVARDLLAFAIFTADLRGNFACGKSCALRCGRRFLRR